MISDGFLIDLMVMSMVKKMNYKPGQGLEMNEQEILELPDFETQDNTRGLGYTGIGLGSKGAKKRYFNRNNLLKNVGSLKDSFVKEGKEKFYLGEK